jgi:hypothetical protein
MKYKNAVLHAADNRFPERMPMENRRRGTRIRDFRAFEFAKEKQELWLGVGERSCFTSRDEAKAAWIKHRDFLLLTVGSNGHRPAAWWIFEVGLPPPDQEVETSTLWAMGALGEAEEAEIMKRWREEFERSFRYQGAQAREWRRWADIPATLVRAWGVERRHSAAQIKQLASAESNSRSISF